MQLFGANFSVRLEDTGLSDTVEELRSAGRLLSAGLRFGEE